MKMIKLYTSLFLLSLAFQAQAAIVQFTSVIDGAQANAGAGTGSAATGTGNYSLDTVSNLFSWNIIFSGLGSPETVAHIHGPALANQNAGVQINLDLGSPKVGSTIINASQATDLLDDLWYVNIHSQGFPGGEIRGQLIMQPVPIPAAVWFFSAGIVGLIGLARRDFRRQV